MSCKPVYINSSNIKCIKKVHFYMSCRNRSSKHGNDSYKKAYSVTTTYYQYHFMLDLVPEAYAYGNQNLETYKISVNCKSKG